MLGLPVLTIYLILTSKIGSLTFSPSLLLSTFTSMSGLSTSTFLSNLFNSALILTLWLLLSLTLHLFLPTKKILGSPIRHASNKRLEYTINGHLQFWVTLLLVCLFEFVSILPPTCSSPNPPTDDGSTLSYLTSYVSGSPNPTTDTTTSCPKGFNLAMSKTSPLSNLPSLFISLSIVTTLFTTVFSIYLYLTSYTANKILAVGGNTPSSVYNFFIGRELNPRVAVMGREVDLKEWMELKPGLIGWTVVNLSFARSQYVNQGYVSGAMTVLCLSQGLYTWDALYNEEAILTTMDITTDGFGWMLCFGDLGWVTFTYCLQAHYLLYNDPGLSSVWCGLCGILGFTGYWIFRRSNSEKNRFRSAGPESDPSFEYIDTARGTKLLVSGWWGTARKINYTGDWILGLSWCLLTGTSCMVTYFYSIYFAVLLVHRAWRDDEMCRGKYGDDWGRYKEIVEWVFIPGVV